MEDAALKQATISFTVSKAWLTENNVQPADVVLLRFHNSAWETYTPSAPTESDGFYKFEAKVPGFSTFAVGIKTQAAVQQPGTQPETSTEPAETPAETGTEQTSFLPVVLVIVVLAVIVGVVWYLVGRRK